MPISDIFPKAGITFWDCAHEGSGGMMADGFTRASGKMCMMIAQNGPGITNFVTAVKTAYWNHTPLLLVTPHARYRINSQFANEPWFAAREPQVLWVHPTDAAARGLAEARDAEIRSPDGTVRAPVHVTEAIMPGVVCLNAGAWPAIGQGAGAGGTAGAANWLTSTEPTTPSQGSRTHSVAVQVSLPAEA